MSLDSTGGIHKHQQMTPLETAKEAEEIAKVKQQMESEKLMQSSIGKAEEEKILQHLEPSNPQLKPPNVEYLAQKTNLQKENLTDQNIVDELSKFPQFEGLLSSQNFITKDHIVDYARQVMLGNLAADMSITALAGKALAEKVREAAGIEKNPVLDQALSDIKLELLYQNHPSSKILVESLKNDLISEGKPPEAAEKLAKEKALQMIESKYGGDVTTSNPKINSAIANLLAAQLGGTQAAKNFIASLNGLMGMEGKLSGIFDALAKVSSGEKVGEVGLKTNQDVIKSAQEIIDEAMTQLGKVPLPEDQKIAILDFMQKISEALALLDRLMSELNISEAQRSKAEFGAKVDSIMTNLKAQLDELRKAMRKIRKAKKKAKKFGVLGKIMKILNKVMAGIMMAVILVAMVAMLGLMVVAAPLAILALIGLGALFVGVIVSLAMSETGEMDKMMDAFFDIAFMILTEVLGLDISKETAGLIMIGVIGAIAVLPILLSVLLLPLLLVLLPLLLVLAPLLIGPAILVFAVILLVAMVMSVGLAPLVIQFLPEMILRSGLLETIAAKIGKELGMSEGQINDIETALRGAVAMVTVSTGMNVSSSFGKLSEKDQKLVDGEEKKKGKIWEAKSKAGRVSPYQNIGQVKTLNDLAAMRASSPEEIEKRKEELQEMIAMLGKIIAQMKKLLAALMAGGDPAAMDGAIKAIQNIIDNEMTNFITPSGKELDIKPFVQPLVQSTLQGLPNVLPSPDAIKQQLRDIREQEIFQEDEESLIRTQELMG